MDLILPIMAVVAALIALITCMLLFKLWMKAALSGAHVSFPILVAMKLRGVPSKIIVNSHIMAVRAGLNISTCDLESHFLAGGKVESVVQAMVAATKGNLGMTWQEIVEMDLAGRNVLDVVRTSVEAKSNDHHEGNWSANASDVQLVGAVGEVLTPFTPVGTIEIEGRRINAVWNGVFIEEGARIRVVEVQEDRVVVEEAELTENI